MTFRSSLRRSILFVVGSIVISYLIYKATGIWFLFLLIPFAFLWSGNRKRR